MDRPNLRLVLAALVCASLAACGEDVSEADADSLKLAKDPILARALNDPLMVDPDLASRSLANAAITFSEGHPLPPLEARDDAAARAREIARLELLENGQLPDVPAAVPGDGPAAIGGLDNAGEIIEALGSRTDCIDSLDGRLIWSTELPDTSSIMPHGMVQQAAGVDVNTCVIRVVRYLTPVSVEDALEYHFTKADRARFSIERFDTPEVQIRGERRDQALAVHFREGPGGLTEVDVVHWRK